MTRKYTYKKSTTNHDKAKPAERRGRKAKGRVMRLAQSINWGSSNEKTIRDDNLVWRDVDFDDTTRVRANT